MNELANLMLKRYRIESELREFEKPVFTFWYILLCIILIPFAIGIVMIIIGIIGSCYRGKKCMKLKEQLIEIDLKIEEVKKVA